MELKYLSSSLGVAADVVVLDVLHLNSLIPPPYP